MFEHLQMMFWLVLPRQKYSSMILRFSSFRKRFIKLGRVWSSVVMTLSRSCCEQGCIELTSSLSAVFAQFWSCMKLAQELLASDMYLDLRFWNFWSFREMLFLKKYLAFCAVNNIVNSSSYHLLLKIIQSSGVEPRPSDEDCESFH